MLFIRSCLFNILFFLWTFYISLQAAFGILINPDFILRTAAMWGRGTHRLLKGILGITYEIRGQHHWDGKPAIFASLHHSTLETTMIQVLAFRSAIILKKELTYLPFFGQAIKKAGIIALDRRKGGRILPQLIQGAKFFISQGRSLFIFPQGTRKDPDGPIELRHGVVALYDALNVPVYPVVLNTGHVWGRRSFIKRPGHVVYEIMPPIQPGLSSKAFREALTQSLKDGYQKIHPSSA